MPPTSRDTHTLFNKIITGNAGPSDYTMSNYQSLFKKIEHSWSMCFVGDVASLNSTQKLNLIAYVRNSFENSSGTSTLQPVLLKATIQLFHNLFTNIKGSDENAVQETKALTDLFDKVLANNIHFVNSQYNLLYDLTINAQQFGTHLGNIIKNIADPLRPNHPSDDLLATFLHAIKSLAALPAYGKSSYSELIALLTQVRRDCLSIKSCNHKLSLSEFFAILGVLYKENNDGSDRSKPAVSVIQDHALALMETVKNSHFAQSDGLDSNEVKKLALRFSQQAFSDHSSDAILKQCAEIFGLDNCNVLPEPTSTLASNNTSIMTSASSEQTETSTLTSLSEQTDTTISTHEQTTLDSSLPAQSHLLEKVGASAITGLTQGMKSELINILLKLCLENIKDKPPLIKNLMKGTFMLIETVSSAALPILYNFAYNLMLAEDEKDPLSDNELYTSIIISCALQALGAAFYLLPNSKFKTALSYLHMPLIACYLFASLENKTEAAITWAASSVTAIAGKAGVAAAVKLAGNRFTIFSTSDKENNSLRDEEKEIEMDKLLTLSSTTPDSSSNNSNRSSSNSSDTSATTDASDLQLKLDRFSRIIESSNLMTREHALTQINSLKDNWKTLVNQVNKYEKKFKSNPELIKKLNEIKGNLILIQSQLNEGPSYPSEPIENCCKSLESVQIQLNKLIIIPSFTELHTEKCFSKSPLTPLVGYIQGNVTELFSAFHTLETTKIKREYTMSYKQHNREKLTVDAHKHHRHRHYRLPQELTINVYHPGAVITGYLHYQ